MKLPYDNAPLLYRVRCVNLYAAFVKPEFLRCLEIDIVFLFIRGTFYRVPFEFHDKLYKIWANFVQIASRSEISAKMNSTEGKLCRPKLDFLSSGFSKSKDDCSPEGLFLIPGEIADDLREIEAALKRT
ncbi:MAG: hypothetical protein AB1805_12820 [Nitrospirota bacterium]